MTGFFTGGPSLLGIGIFGKGTTVGLVKLYVEKAKKELEPIVRKIADPSSAPAKDSDHKFELDPDAAIFKQDACSEE